MNDETAMPKEESPLPLRMLYVEDNALVREITCDLFAGDIREIVAVATGEEALGIFKASRFDVVVTDVSLPAMSGLELMRQITKLDPNMPVILASGYPLDAVDYSLGPSTRAITKPFSAPELRALIQELCRVTTISS